MNCTFVCCLALAGLLVAPAGRATTYRWVDKSGNVHYGDSLPALYPGSSYDVLDNEGRVIRHVTATPSRVPGGRQEGDKTMSPAAVAAQNQEWHDNALLATYSNTHEIDQARDRALAQEKAIVESLQVLLKQAQTAAEKKHLENTILQHYLNMKTIREQYAADKKRYQELTGKP